VCRPPEGDFLAEDAVPDVVQREPEKGVQSGTRDEDATGRGEPVAGDSDRGRAGAFVEGEHDASMPAMNIANRPTRMK